MHWRSLVGTKMDHDPPIIPKKKNLKYYYFKPKLYLRL
jgi:hypothetical protein